MISIEGQQNLLLTISRKLKNPLNIYAIGGTAMMFLGFKDVTLDIDLVFDNEGDREAFKQVIKDIGYKEMNPVQVYGTRRNQPEMFTLGDERFDLFVDDVIDFKFSLIMKARAEAIHQFGDKLILKVANPHDIILMKCATERAKDMDDARRIIENTKIDWNLIINEAKNQIDLGKTRAAFELGEFLEKLKGAGVDIPDSLLDELFEIVKKQADEKKTKGKR